MCAQEQNPGEEGLFRGHVELEGERQRAGAALLGEGRGRGGSLPEWSELGYCPLPLGECHTAGFVRVNHKSPGDTYTPTSQGCIYVYTQVHASWYRLAPLGLTSL